MLATPFILALGGAFSVLVVFLGVALATRPTRIAERLDRFGGRPMSLAEREMQEPFSQRVLRPAIKSLSRMVASRTPQGTIEQIRRDLLVAGSPSGLDVRDFLGLKAVGALGCGGIFLLAFARSLPLFQAAAVGVLLVVIGYNLPNFWLKSKISKRKQEILRALPDALDLLTICVEAGLGFDAALNKVTDKWTNPLTLEFERVLAEIRMGRSRRDALRDLITRTDVPDVSAFVGAIIQADQLGVSIGNVLVSQAEQMRVNRRQRAEKLAHEAPVKMIFPMVLLILPALFVVILGPALPSILNGFSAAQ